MTKPTHPTKHQTIYSNLLRLNSDLQGAKDSPKVQDLQDLAERTWKANYSFENEMARLENEKKELQRIMKHIWKGFDDVILPMWKIDDALIPVYESLVQLHRELDQLQAKASTPDSLVTLKSLQDRLHAVENDHCVNGKFVPLGWKSTEKVPSGQALLATLLQRCYKTARIILEREPVVSKELTPVKQRLDNTVQHLKMLRENFLYPADYEDFGRKPIEPMEIQLIQEKLSSIEASKKDGNFVDEDGTILEGQAILTSTMEEAYDLVHEILLEMDKSEPTGEISDILDSAIQQAKFAKNAIVGHVESAASEVRHVSLPIVHTLQDSLAEGVTSLRRAIEHPQDTAEKTRKTLASTTRSAFSYISDFLGEFEPVDPSLMPMYKELLQVRLQLRDLKKEMNIAKVKKAPEDAAHITRFSELRQKLNEIDAKKVDGSWKVGGLIPRGQATISALVDECYCLVAEMM